MDPLSQLLERRRAAGRRGKCLDDVLRHGFRRQPGECDLAGKAPRTKRLAKLRLRAVGIVPAGRSQGGDHEELRGIHPRSHTRDPVKRRRVAPVEVFDRQDKGVVGGQRFDRDGQLPQHPIRGAPDEPQLKRGRLAWCEEARQLGQPHRCELLERFDRPVAVRTTAQSHERVEERLVWLADAVLLDAVAPRHGDVVPLAQPGERFGQDRTLPYPGFAADEADLAGPASSSIEGVDQQGDIGLSTNERRG